MLPYLAQGCPCRRIFDIRPSGYPSSCLDRDSRTARRSRSGFRSRHCCSRHPDSDTDGGGGCGGQW